MPQLSLQGPQRRPFCCSRVTSKCGGRRLGEQAAPPDGEPATVALKLVCILELKKNSDVEALCQRHSLTWFGVQSMFRYLG